MCTLRGRLLLPSLTWAELCTLCHQVLLLSHKAVRSTLCHQALPHAQIWALPLAPRL